ncbi:hypothetical protein KAJ27_16575 [bacterium]|nr:hypothetical protein [bacterium]
MSGILDLVSKLGKTLVNNVIDEFVESLNTVKSNQTYQKKSTIFNFSDNSGIDSPNFWDDLENRPTPKSTITPKKRKVIRPSLSKKKTQKAPVPETQPEPEINEMSDAEVNEELRAIKEMLKKKTA